MASFKSLAETAQQIAFYIDQLNAGKLSAMAIDDLLNEVRELEARLIILRYKAYEQQAIEETAPEPAPAEAENTWTTFSIDKAEPETSTEPQFSVGELNPEVVLPEPESAFEQPIPFGIQELTPEIEAEGPATTAFHDVIQEAMERAPEHHEDLNDAIKKAASYRQQVVQQTLMIEPVLETSPPAQKSGQATLANQLQRSGISDLNKVIAIADKYNFIVHLFDSNNEAYTAAINKINHCGSWSAAKDYMDQQLAPTYRWNRESATVQQFTDLVERMYA